MDKDEGISCVKNYSQSLIAKVKKLKIQKEDAIRKTRTTYQQ
jgi:hypothetical protein